MVGEIESGHYEPPPPESIRSKEAMADRVNNAAYTANFLFFFENYENAS